MKVAIIERSIVYVFRELETSIAIVSATEKTKNQFEQEPIELNYYRREFNETKYFDNEPSKYISKPKRNYKK